MELREVKKEVELLPDICKIIDRLNTHWIKPIRVNTNLHLPSLNSLPPLKRKEMKCKMEQFQETLSSLRSAQKIHDKCRLYAHYLVELKLASLQGNPFKAKMVSKKLLHDEYLIFSNTLKEVQGFKENVNLLSQQYKEMSESLQKELPLEEGVAFLDLPHKMYLQQLQKIPFQQNKVMKELGKQLVSTIKEVKNNG